MSSDIELKPAYSTREISGRCIRCLAEQEYGDCLRDLLRGDIHNEELRARYQALISLLTSEELEPLIAETERYLSDGKEVKVLLHLEAGEPTYEIRVD